MTTTEHTSRSCTCNPYFGCSEYRQGCPVHWPACVCDAFDYEAEGPCFVPGHDSRATAEGVSR